MNLALQSSHDRGTSLALHRHAHSYAALVLCGEYEECSVDGRFRCSRGDLIVHPPFHAHRNAFGPSGARVLNIALAADSPSQYRVVRATDASRLVRRAQFRPSTLADALIDETELQPVTPAAPPRWMTDMAQRLRADAAEGLRSHLAIIAAASAVSPQHASRAFVRHFGVTPTRFRLEYKLRRAFALLRNGASPSFVASETGFADQSHLTREMKRFSNRTPRDILRPGTR